MIVVPGLEFVHVTVIGELELPEAGVQLGAVAADPIVYVPATKVLGGPRPVGLAELAGKAELLDPAIAYSVEVEEIDIALE